MSSLKHYGVQTRSGRYPWGSGEYPYQRLGYRAAINQMKKDGWSEEYIAGGFGITQAQLRANIANDRAEQYAADASRAMKLKYDKGYSNTEIARIMGKNESTIRSLLEPAKLERATIITNTANMLKEQIEKKGPIDVGKGVEYQLGITKNKLDTAISKLEQEGYKIGLVQVDQYGTNNQKTTMRVLMKETDDIRDLKKDPALIRAIKEPEVHSEDGGRTYLGMKPPVSLDPKRVSVRYREDGGEDMDGVIQLRRGVADIALGDKSYAQVRIAVGGTHYLKGMAIYSDDLPKGVDVLFNTNKPKDVPMMGPKDNSVLKSLKNDPDNPFGARINRQIEYADAKGKMHQSVINTVNEEGSWNEWSNRLSSQFLSKQPPSLIQDRLDTSLQIKKDEFDEIKSYTNLAVQKKLLSGFANDCDASAAHLKAAGMPRQSSFVILPVTDMKPTEVYAPRYNNGERVVLIRHPHGGIFEIPELVVNNKNPSAKNVVGNAIDAIGIHHDVAKKLSGADFDGDSVIVIPNNKASNDPTKIHSSPSLEALKNFDPKISYPGYPGMPEMTDTQKQTEMGKISNLITDMSIQGAEPSEIARAVKHSMVVIDAQKHELNYKLSYKDNQIALLKEKYQGGKNRGASTLISLAESEYRVDHRKDSYSINKETGEKEYKYTGKSYEQTIKGYTDAKTGLFIKGVPNPDTGKFEYKGTGKIIKNKTLSTQMNETPDAYSLSSGTQVENLYAEYANSLKAMANEARRLYVNIPSEKTSPSAKTAYASEIASLKSKLVIAKSNKPAERQARRFADAVVRSKLISNPGLSGADKSKIHGQALATARDRAGAKKQPIEITPREWAAIQAHAIPFTTLMEILDNTSMDVVKSYATPKNRPSLSSSALSRARQMMARGNVTLAEIAESLGVSVSTLSNALKGD